MNKNIIDKDMKVESGATTPINKMVTKSITFTLDDWNKIIEFYKKGNNTNESGPEDTVVSLTKLGMKNRKW